MTSEPKTEFATENFSPPPQRRLSSPEWLKVHFPLLTEEEFCKSLFSQGKNDLPDLVIFDKPTRASLTVSVQEQNYPDVKEKFDRQFDKLIELAADPMAEEIEAKAARVALFYVVSHAGLPVIFEERRRAVERAVGALIQMSLNVRLTAEIFQYVTWLLSFGGDLYPETKSSLVDCFVNCLRFSQKDPDMAVEGAIRLALTTYDHSSQSKAQILRLIDISQSFASGRLAVYLDVVADVIQDNDVRMSAVSAAGAIRGMFPAAV